MSDKEQDEIRKAFESETEIVTSALNYIIYDYGFRAGSKSSSSRIAELDRQLDGFKSQYHIDEVRIQELEKEVERLKAVLPHIHMDGQSSAGCKSPSWSEAIGAVKARDIDIWSKK